MDSRTSLLNSSSASPRDRIQVRNENRILSKTAIQSGVTTPPPFLQAGNSLTPASQDTAQLHRFPAPLSKSPSHSFSPDCVNISGLSPVESGKWPERGPQCLSTPLPPTKLVESSCCRLVSSVRFHHREFTPGWVPIPDETSRVRSSSARSPDQHSR